MSQEYVVDLLYNGFYYFEMITKRNLDDTICGICGVVGETYFGDGNEKNCCSRKEVCPGKFTAMITLHSFKYYRSAYTSRQQCHTSCNVTNYQLWGSPALRAPINRSICQEIHVLQNVFGVEVCFFII